MPETNLLKQLGTAGLSCCCSQTTVHWTETTMVRQQLAAKGESGNLYSMTRQIAAAEGAKGLYRGYSAAILREMTYSSVRFGMYEPIKFAIAGDIPMKDVPYWKKVVAGLSAGAIAAAMFSPTDLLKLRAQKQTGPMRGMLCASPHRSRPAGSGHRRRAILCPPQVPRAPDPQGAAGWCAQPVPRRDDDDHPGGGAGRHEDGDVRPVQGGAQGRLVDAWVRLDRVARRPGALDREVQGAVRGLDRDGAGGDDDDLPRHERPDAHHVQPTGQIPRDPALLVRHHSDTGAPPPAVHQQWLWIRLLTEAVVQGPLGLYRGFGAQWARFGPYVRRVDTLSNSPFHSISCETEMPLAFRCWRRR